GHAFGCAGSPPRICGLPVSCHGHPFGSSGHPMSTAAGGEVLLLNPTPTFVRVPSLGPAPQRFPDLMVHVCKDGTTDHPPVIVRPTPYAGVQPLYQSGGCNRGVSLMNFLTLSRKERTPFLEGLLSILPGICVPSRPESQSRRPHG